MTTPRAISLHRALLLAYTTLSALQYQQCHAFLSCPSSSLARDVGMNLPQHLSFKEMNGASSSTEIGLFGKTTGEEEDRSRPNIVVIKTHEDYIKFLEEDDRLCAIKFYANWCKSCQKFGVNYRHLAFEEGDRIDIEGSITNMGNVRFAEAEYSASAKLCKSLKVKKLPTVHMYKKGKGKIADMTCKPSLFHLVVDEMKRLLDDESGVAAKSPPDVQLDRESKNNGNVTSESFDELGDAIMTSLKKEEETVVDKRNSWFPFTF